MECKRAVDRIELTADEAAELVFGNGRVRGDKMEVAIPEQERLAFFSELMEAKDDG